MVIELRRPFPTVVQPMKMYVLSLGAGVLVGIVYSLLNVRSPAPPVVALVGLLGILAGERVIPTIKTVLNHETKQHVFVSTPQTGADTPPPKRDE